MKKNVFFVAAIFAALCLNSCDKNDPDNPIAGGSGKILLTTALPNATGMDGTVYMQLIDEPVLGKTMATNNNNGINVPFGSSYPMIIGQEVYVFPSYHLTMDKNELIKYRRTNGILQREGSLQLPANNSANNLVKLSSTKAYLSLAGLGLIYIFNPETMQKTGEINLTSLGIQDNNPDIGIMIERDGYVFAGLSQMVGGWTSPENYKQADVAVIDTKTDKLVKMISEKTSGFSQATRPIDPKSLFMDEKGDIYISCLGNFGMVAGHKAGILWIKKGETDFDQSYYFPIETISIPDIKGNKANYIYSKTYTGNGKLYGYFNVPGYVSNPPDYVNDKSMQTFEIDVYNKTVKKMNFDGTTGWSCSQCKAGDYMVFGMASTQGTGYYLYNYKEDKYEPLKIKTEGNPFKIQYLK